MGEDSGTFKWKPHIDAPLCKLFTEFIQNIQRIFVPLCFRSVLWSFPANDRSLHEICRSYRRFLTVYARTFCKYFFSLPLRFGFSLRRCVHHWHHQQPGLLVALKRIYGPGFGYGQKARLSGSVGRAVVGTLRSPCVAFEIHPWTWNPVGRSAERFKPLQLTWSQPQPLQQTLAFLRRVLQWLDSLWTWKRLSEMSRPWSRDIAGEKTELSNEKKYKSRNVAYEQTTDCHRMRNVHHL